MLKYILGLFKHFFNKRISFLSLVDNKSVIHKKAYVYYFTQIYKSKIGAYTYISPGSSLICTSIGKFCSIARNVSIGLPNHPLNKISTSPIFYSKNNALKIKWNKINLYSEFKAVVIGNDVWIGANVIIMGGTKIGNGAIIGAGAIVTKDIPPYSICVGVPAKVIKYRFDEKTRDEILKSNWWDLPDEILKEKYINI